MNQRIRKLVGTAVIIIFCIAYALMAMVLAQAALLRLDSRMAQGALILVLGLIWILPLIPLIRWMEGKGED